MKKVAFFSEILIEDFDGASRTMFQIINRIDSSSFSYLFIHGKGPDKVQSHQSYQVPTLRIPINEDYSFAVPQLTKAKLEAALDEFQPDVIHIATPSLLGFFALKYAKHKNIPVISIYHTHFISYIAYYLRNLSTLIRPVEYWMRKAMLRFYNSCQKIYVPAHNIMEELKEIGIHGDRLALWQRGIDLNLFNPAKRNPAYIQSITHNQKPNILFASRLVWEKNVQTLIAIYQQLKRSGVDCNFIVAGDGSAYEDARQQMPEAFFLGKLNHGELSKLYASSDVFVFTSTSETYGNVVIEAMASGLPCVIANGGGSASLVEHDLNGFKCTPNNPLEYVYYIDKILKDERVKNRLQHEGLAYVQQLDWTNLANTYFADICALSRAPMNTLNWASNAS